MNQFGSAFAQSDPDRLIGCTTNQGAHKPIELFIHNILQTINFEIKLKKTLKSWRYFQKLTVQSRNLKNESIKAVDLKKK